MTVGPTNFSSGPSVSIDASLKPKGSGSLFDWLIQVLGLPSFGGLSPVVYNVCEEHSLWNSLAFFLSMSVVNLASMENNPERASELCN